jgi:hypothetical protein
VRRRIRLRARARARRPCSQRAHARFFCARLFLLPRASLAPLAQVFASGRIAAMLGLGFASGLPLALSSGTLQAWLTVEGIDIKTIGIFALE